MTDAEEKLFQANKKRIDEHLLREYPGIDKFNKGKATKDLSRIVPLDYLKDIVYYHWLFAKYVTKKPANLGRGAINTPAFPRRELSQIEDILNGLHDKKWLPYDSNLKVTSQMDFIYKQILQSPNGRAWQIEKVKNQFRNKKGGRWEKFALKFIIFFFGNTCKRN